MYDLFMKTSFDLIIQNAEVVLPDSQNLITNLTLQKTDIGIKYGKIAAIGDLKTESSDQVIDAKGLTLTAGLIDSQVHFREPGLTHKEDLQSGTLAAIHGGITTVFEMPNTNPSTSTIEAFQQKMSLAQNRCYSHYAFYFGATHDNIDQLAHLESSAHTPGIKIFMGSSTGNLLVEDDEALIKILSSGKRRVIVHSEDEYRLRERKHIATDSQDVKNHHVWRDAQTAYQATERLIRIARQTQRPVHVLHITTQQEVEFLANQKDIATVEVLPQHLTLSAPDCYERLGSLAQQNPPIREKHHQDALWKALNNGTIDVIGSDHAPHTLEEKAKTYPNSPSGVPGVQTLLPIMLNHVHENRLSFLRLIEMLTENPRRIFGCHSKGRIAVGLDADFTLIDLNKTMTIQNSMMKSKVGWTPFDQMKVRGWPVATIIDGKVVMREGETLEAPQGRPVSFQF